MSEMKEVSWAEVAPAIEPLTLKVAADTLTGMALEDATAWLEAHKVEYLIVAADSIRDTQYRENRVNLTVTGNIITNVAIG